jgi:hypothetical protein
MDTSWSWCALGQLLGIQLDKKNNIMIRAAVSSIPDGVAVGY